MRILILNNHAPSLYNFRKELIDELIINNEVYISMPENEFSKYFQNIGCKIINTNISRRSINPLKDIVLLSNYYNIIKKTKPNLIITYTIKPNIYGGICARLYKTPYAVNIPGLGSAFNGSNIVKRIVITLYKIALKSAKIVFFENIENRDIFINEKIISLEQSYLLNGAGVNIEKYRPLEYPSDPKINFLFIARIMKEKGIDELIEACNMLEKDGFNFKLSILGEFEEDYRDIFEQLKQKAWFNYYGYKKDTIPFIKDSHCFVLPSWHEGMANTNLECAASARPIITSNIHGCKEAVIDGVSGFVCQKQNSTSLYNAMKKFIELPYDEKLEMGIESRNHIEKNFNRKLVVNKTIEELKKCSN